VRRLGSVCTGAFILAAAGLLDGRRATTHWRYCAELAATYPAIIVEPDALHIRDGAVTTSAGVTAGMDLALALLEEDCGRRLALATAREIVAFLKRPGGQSQFSTHLEAQAADLPVRGLQEWILSSLAQDLSVEALAARTAMSPRHFARVFARETGTTPAKFVERARIEAARRVLESSALSLDVVAERCGFGHQETMRRVFQRHLKVAPQAYRRRFRAPAPASWAPPQPV
jgi:transcriptional regulator GlxA family with amidase domain